MQYPRTIWAITRAQVIIENGREVVSHERDDVVGATFCQDVAEKLVALLRANESPETMVRSDVVALPSNVLDVLTQTNDSVIDRLMQMADIPAIAIGPSK